MNIKLKRIYDEPSAKDGHRVLVDRLWPRGISKQQAALDDWAKKLTPSSELRKWFDHDPGKWKEFKTAYREELESKEETLRNFIEQIRDKNTINFLYAAKDTEYTHAILLKDVVEEKA